ncbi:hypothetical protein HMPREF9952_0750 [Haemophilus pittmaniae HK 85]|uniref:Uncharacterized protein n=1 Tax=Haemophilus pittmaniae HK 85 TaxID=1035188 RepID=F9Q9P7_9PAST|nr:hypothetical protein HMPREF9952_0750 [Haemophilus pittmaniae HK 85]
MDPRIFYFPGFSYRVYLPYPSPRKRQACLLQIQIARHLQPRVLQQHQMPRPHLVLDDLIRLSQHPMLPAQRPQHLVPYYIRSVLLIGLFSQAYWPRKGLLQIWRYCHIPQLSQ